MQLLQLAKSLGKAVYFFLSRRCLRDIVGCFSPRHMPYTHVRLGRAGDGGYVILKELVGPAPVLLSFGINDDTSFEEDFVRLFPDARVYCFDPSIEALPRPNPSLNFYRLGLAGRDEPSRNLYSLASIYRKLGLEPGQPVTFKMDIEGWEWPFFASVDLRRFNIVQLATELHFLPPVYPLPLQKKLRFPMEIRRCRSLLKQLMLEYEVAHVHANNSSYLKTPDGDFPSFLEATFVRKSVLIRDANAFHRSLYVPNYPACPDHQYPFFRSPGNRDECG